MRTEITSAERQKEIRILLARWIKGQRAKQRKSLPVEPEVRQVRAGASMPGRRPVKKN